MDNAGYITLTRQSGLLREISVVANNIANAATTGYRQEGLVFSEYVQNLDGTASLSMATADTQNISMAQGALTKTGGTFDFAIEGDGFFAVETSEGPRLTRAGNFSPNAQGDLVTLDGLRVLDSGGAPIFVPPDTGPINVSSDGTISVEGRPIAQLGLFEPIDPTDLRRQGGVMFEAPAGRRPAQAAKVVQGFLENSNVDAVSQLARMIEVQRAYEMGQGFLEKEDERVRNALKTFTR